MNTLKKEWNQIMNEISNDKCSWIWKQKTWGRCEDVFGAVEEMKEEESFWQIVYKLMMKVA